MLNRHLLLTLVVIVSSAGCTKLSERTHARYELGTPLKLRSAEPGGLYQVKWSATADGPRRTVPGTQRLVRRGEPVGFMRDQDGTVLAVAGQAQFKLTGLPPEATHCVWSTEFPRDSRLAQGVGGAGRLALNGVGLIGLGFLQFLLADDTDEGYCYDWFDPGHSHGDDSRSGGDGPADRNTSSRGTVPWASPPITR